MSESELDDLMGEVGGPCNVTGMINMFQDKMANAEIDDIFEQFDVDEDYMVKTKEVVGLFVAVKEEEKKEEKKEEVVEAAPEEEGDDAKKKKKKKKKAAK